MIRVYTSCTKAYLPKARVLAHSVKQQQPDFSMVLMFCDNLPDDFNLAEEPFDQVLTIADLNRPEFDRRWIFTHTVVELCTAVKGAALSQLLAQPDTDAVLYLDPDTWVLSSLQPVIAELSDADVIVTPHLLEPVAGKWEVHAKEIVTTMAHGIFNLGFIGVKNSEEGRRFAHWWDERLGWFCYDEVPLGIFTDQRWCDFVPVFFPTSKVIRNKGWNVATWNIEQRPIEQREDGYYAGGDKLVFYHFTGFDAGRNFDQLLLKHAERYPAALSLWEDYGRALAAAGHDTPALKHWQYDSFDDGEKITAPIRRIYRDNDEIQAKYPDPFASGEGSYQQWCRETGAFALEPGIWPPELNGIKREALELQKKADQLQEENARLRSLRWQLLGPLRAVWILFRRLQGRLNARD